MLSCMRPRTLSLLLTRQRLWQRHAGSLLLGWLLLASSQGHATPPLWSEPHGTEAALPALQQLNEALIRLTEKVLPAVVSLRVQTVQEIALPENHPPVPEQERPGVTGSGVIIRQDGLIITNYHVVEGQTAIEALLYDGTLSPARVLGVDPAGDLALLKISTENALPILPLGNSEALQVGEFVVAIGSPFGFEHTVTFGIVSAKKRQFFRSGVVGGYIQTDAPITTGNSGGPLVNMRGEVVGINTATIGRGELGFAIPIAAVKQTLPQLYETGQVARGWLGVQIRPLGRDKAQTLGITRAEGVYVHEVLPEQPAHRAGLAAGDVIVRFDSLAVRTPFDLQRAVAGTPAGRTVQVEFWRQHSKRTVEIVLGKMPQSESR